MTALASPPIIAIEPQVRQWTREEFYRLGELGLFQGQRAELIEGVIMVLSPQNWPHASTVDRVTESLRRALPPSFWVRGQLPLNLNQTTEPEPDISVVIGSRDDYHDHPTSAVLIVEVSDTTLSYDRGQKASLYARAGIADYWIVNLVDRRLEVRRTPVADATQLYGHGYASLTELVPPAAVNLLAAPQVSLAVADLIA
jgi:Uma2 family endonuclease